MEVLDGKKVRNELLEKYKEYIKDNNFKIKLAIIQIGNNEASNIYVGNKEKYCNYVGITTDIYKLDESISEDEVINLINKLNNDKLVTGIILQSPTPKHINFDYVSGLILSSKDVDGFTKENIYNLYLNNEKIIPCTVKGIIRLLEYYNIDLDGKNVVIVGRGKIVGEPLFLALTNRNATVTLAHSHTKDLKSITRDKDIIISATGVANIITSEMVKNSAIVIDVGVNRNNGKIAGDVFYDEVKDKCSYITPNPGGVGPMTIAMIIENLIEMKESGK